MYPSLTTTEDWKGWKAARLLLGLGAGSVHLRSCVCISPGLVLALGNFVAGLFTRARLTVRTLHGGHSYDLWHHVTVFRLFRPIRSPSCLEYMRTTTNCIAAIDYLLS